MAETIRKPDITDLRSQTKPDITDLRSQTIEELQETLAALGEPKFRAKQLFSWFHQKKVATYEEMTNLSKPLREKLQEKFPIGPLKIERMQQSALDGTRKYLFLLQDGNLIESVYMQYHHGNTVCISTQVGCNMGCKFCASTIGGKVRDLKPFEMLSQIYEIEKDTDSTVSNVVLMGAGEPLDNFENVIRFLSLITHPEGKMMSHRNITLSTCGLVEKIKALADLDPGITLALSLHAGDQETRQKLLPIANKYDLQEVIGACDYYFQKTGRRVTYEYSVVRGVNDTEEEAKKLGKLLHGKNAHVNLIPVNPVLERGFEKPLQESLVIFTKILDKYGINATIRRELGADIDGACGQLRRRVLQEESE